MRKAIYAVGILAALAAVVLAYTTRVDAQARNRFTVQAPFPPLVGPGASIGITVRDGDSGVVVQEVRSDSPAAHAGVKEGDIVTEFDGERTRSAAQFTRLVRETAPGRTVQMAVQRNGTATTLDIAPEARNSDDVWFPNLTQVWPRDFNFDFDFGDGYTPFSQRRLGVSVTPISDQLAAYFGVKQGALVSEVAAGSAGEMAGIKAGDVITTVRGQAVTHPGDVVRELREAEAGSTVEIRVMRDRKELTLTAKMPERAPVFQRRSGRII